MLEILGLLEPFDLERHVADTAAWHLFAEASRLAYADRARYLGDPDFVAAPVDGPARSAYLAARAQLIDPERVACRAGRARRSARHAWR